MKVRITVIKKILYSDLAEEYIKPENKITVCDDFEVGSVFIYNGAAEMPVGFCPWAWIDIYKTVSAISAGASFDSWYKAKNTSIECCSDGIRPVVFKIEAINEEKGEKK